MRVCFLLLFLFISSGLLAQSGQGRVSDETGLPLDNAYIYNLRSGSHAHSNEGGYFVITSTQAGDSLTISHVSYQSRTWIWSDSSHRNEIRLLKAPFEMGEVILSSAVNHLNIISGIDLKTNPVNTSQELLRRVPGLFIGQHAGGGKAEQIFLRGFDIDHGTDINISVDGMPVNMVSHAHGQGYADLHFLIPETVDKIDFDKGPYYANRGNLATAGYVAFKTKERLDQSSISIEAGKFNTVRMLGLFDLVNTTQQSAYLAAEYLNTDGYFESPQHFHRLNLLGKYTAVIGSKDKVSLSFSHLNSKWNASGQVPQRAIDQGLITRFGSIDNTEGGNTQRSNINLQHLHTISNNSYLKNTAWYSRYGFELFSNFTFFLEDPVNGDQIKQKEARNLFGFETEYNQHLLLGNIKTDLQAGAGVRYDAVKDVELSHTLNRKITLQQLALGDVNETDIYGYVNAEFKTGKWVINPGLRLDYFNFDYEDKLATTYTNPAVSKTIASPKLNILYNGSHKMQYFLKMGKGFHSNDTRVVTKEQQQRTLPAAWGADAGVLWKPVPRMLVNAALWYLYLQQEFVYVGDAAVVEPGGKTRREGIDLGIRYQLGKFVFLHSDFTYTHARASEEAKGEDYIPLAPTLTLAGGLSFKTPGGFAGSIKTRWLGNRPANEDNSIVAKGYCITDMNLNYSYRAITIGVITENVFNSRWNETQFATESRLRDEPDPVTEIHFTPGTPFNIRGQLICRF